MVLGAYLGANATQEGWQVRACRAYEAYAIRDDGEEGLVWEAEMPYDDKMEIVSVTQVTKPDGAKVFWFWCLVSLPSAPDAEPPMETRKFRLIDGRGGRVTYLETLHHIKTIHPTATSAYHVFEIITRESGFETEEASPVTIVDNDDEPNDSDDDGDETEEEEEEEKETPQTARDTQVQVM